MNLQDILHKMPNILLWTVKIFITAFHFSFLSIAYTALMSGFDGSGNYHGLIKTNPESWHYQSAFNYTIYLIMQIVWFAIGIALFIFSKKKMVNKLFFVHAIFSCIVIYLLDHHYPM